MNKETGYNMVGRRLRAKGIYYPRIKKKKENEGKRKKIITAYDREREKQGADTTSPTNPLR